IAPAACLMSTLSGAFLFSGTGNSLAGSTNTGLADLEGVLNFDGQGNVSGTWTQVSNAAGTNITAMGTYSLTGACVGTISLTDSSGSTYTGPVAMEAPDANGYPNNFVVVLTMPQLIFSGTGRSAFVNPGEAVDNNADFGPGATPAGSVFALFGSNLATKLSQA